MTQAQKPSATDAFWQKLVLPWEEKRQRDPLLVWDGSYRWFRSENVVVLDRYRSGEEILRIYANVLHPLLKRIGRAV
jgi:hypothetical protein